MSEEKALLKAMGDDLVLRIIKILEMNNKRATGELIDSIDYIIGQDKNGNLSIKLLAEFYWVYVNYGRRPGKFVPPDALLEWLKVKGITPTPKIYKREPKVRQSEENRLKSLAYAINLKIFRQGIKAVPFLEQSVSYIEKKYQTELENMWGKEYEAEFEKIFKNNFRAKVQ
jgi:hypothetical protein